MNRNRTGKHYLCLLPEQKLDNKKPICIPLVGPMDEREVVALIQAEGDDKGRQYCNQSRYLLAKFGQYPISIKSEKSLITDIQNNRKLLAQLSGLNKPLQVYGVMGRALYTVEFKLDPSTGELVRNVLDDQLNQLL